MLSQKGTVSAKGTEIFSAPEPKGKLRCPDVASVICTDIIIKETIELVFDILVCSYIQLCSLIHDSALKHAFFIVY